MILTTTHSIEGHKIEDYLGIVTGVSTNLKKKYSLKTTKNLDIITDLINEAKEEAFQDLKTNALKLQANAVVGINIDIETSSAMYFFVSITGTAVKVKI
ncbi:heavy metal-binding domain-containing protein [Seonamhaeicola sp. ML3]|uniref:heavy metal-binding domain-containing protein n=1 Tax=Seonamhaeicola sp. ML3 TaxID=2937786 RepID=UPI002010A0AD|nr:heavy metal-binding domain-containing protein [Seonamhaeicola sp. ML3]